MYRVTVKFKYSEPYTYDFSSIYRARIEYEFWLKAQKRYNTPGCYNEMTEVSIKKLRR